MRGKGIPPLEVEANLPRLSYSCCERRERFLWSGDHSTCLTSMPSISLCRGLSLGGAEAWGHLELGEMDSYAENALTWSQCRGNHTL